MTDTRRYILGIDVGTQSVKAGLVGLENMRLERTASREYPGGALQDAALMWEKTCEAVSELTGSAGGSIEGVGLSGQMHGTVLFEADGSVIGSVINWQDERCNTPEEAFGGATAVDRMMAIIAPGDFEELGVDVMASGFLGATLFHIKNTEPDLFARIARTLLPTDFIRRMLLDETGEYATDPTNAFSTGIFDTRNGCWHEKVIDALGLPREILPTVRPTEKVAGLVGHRAAEATGLAEGTPVVHGGGDNQMAAVGSGVFSQDSPIVINIGTSGQVCAAVGEYFKVPGVDTRSFVRDQFLLVGAGLTGGMAFTWLRDSLMGDLAALGVEYGDRDGLFGLLDSLADAVPPGCDGLEFAPYLRGTRRDPALRASFSGISMDNFSPGHRARAVLEGVVNELAGFYEKFTGVAAEKIVGAGNGLVKSDLWRRITARRFGMPLYVTNFENAVYGAALVAAEGLGAAKLEDGVFDYAFVCED